MPINEVKKLCLLGAGTMGSEIAMLCARYGYQVNLYDISAEALQSAPARLKMLMSMAVARGLVTPEEQAQMESVLESINYTTDPEAASKDSDLLIESVPEKLDLKRQVHAQFDKLLPPHAIMCVNTSSLLVSDIESAVQRGDKFSALHFHMGLQPLVDIMRGTRTSPETVDILKRFSKSIGKVPMLMKKEKGGYLYNTMLGAWIRSALSLVIRGYAEPQDVDRAWMLATGQNIAPFMALDSVGIDLALDAVQGLIEVEDEASTEEISAFLKLYVEKGELGMKTGKGFYTFPNPAFQNPDFLKGENSH